MRISYLELRNYRRFRELKLQFPDGIVGILGLNGAGKTTVIESIAWALFGNVDEVVRTSREGVRRVGAGPSDSCSAVLEFELGGTEYRIEREMSGKSLSMKAELRAKGNTLAEGDKPVRKMVEKLIGMDHKSFFTSVFARQKELNALQNVAAGERKKVVLRMLRIDGIDDVLAEVRADKKVALSRIAGAEKTLLTEDGREKEKVLAERLPEMTASLEAATRALEGAERQEKDAARAADIVRKRRDELKKDFDAYNTASSDLKSKQAAIAQLREREKNVTQRLSESLKRLERLPSLEKDEEAWKAVGARKEQLEEEKRRSDKATMIKTEIFSDEKEEARRLDELAKIRSSVSRPDEIVRKIDETEGTKSACETRKAEIAGRVGELKAQVRERTTSAEKDKKKLAEIKGAGKDGVCPTCERRLDESYELLVGKLGESSQAADHAAEEARAQIDSLEAELRALHSKSEALRKRRVALDEDLARLKRAEASAEAAEAELARLRTKLSQRKKDLEAIGELRFSAEEYERVVRDHARLKASHDEYLKLRTVREHAEDYRRDIEHVRESTARHSMEERQFAEIVKTLEPKKELFNATIKELDEKTALLNAAKDDVRRLAGTRDKAQSELDRTKGEIEEIRRIRKAIESDRQVSEDLGLLEEVVVSFKDNLIGRIAPALSELTSRNLGSMTDGRYSGVELDENYEMQIDDQGTMYPVSRFSGGESDLANLSLRLAISSIIADRTGAVPINFLILDEIFGSQDPIRKRSVMTALSRLSGQFRQMFLITHIEDIKDSMSYVIRVQELPDGTSTAELSG